jgi:RNAse (barnase) inhibitor barstar
VAKLEQKLLDSSRAGPYLAPPGAGALASAVRKAGLQLVRVDLKGVRDKQGLLDAVAKALRFPEWFGGNWDALQDCLTDLSWNKARGYVVLLEHGAEFTQCAPREIAAAIEVFESVAEYWAEQDKPFWTLLGGIKTPVPGVKPLA